MTSETTVSIRVDSATLSAALLKQVGDVRLVDHAFDPAYDELQVSYDTGGFGRVALTLVFELDEQQMAQVLADARPPL